MEDSSNKINMILYIINEGDVKEPRGKWEIIPNKLYTIGRSKKEVDITIDEKLLSRKHAELIYYNNKKIMIRDLDSRNGTYINKKRIDSLKNEYFTIKDILSFGNITNEIVFIDGKEETKRKDSELEKTEIIKNDEKKSYKNSNIIDTNNYNNIKDSYSNGKRRSYLGSDTYRSKPRYTPRSPETYHERSRSRNYSRGGDKEYRRSNRNYYEKDYEYKKTDNDYDYEYCKKSFEKYRDIERRENSKKSERREEYMKEMRERDREWDKIRERERDREEVGRNSMYRRSKRNYDDEELSRDKIVLNIDRSKRIEEQLGNIPEDVGYIKCYVSGYMVLNIKK